MKSLDVSLPGHTTKNQDIRFVGTKKKLKVPCLWKGIIIVDLMVLHIKFFGRQIYFYNIQILILVHLAQA